VNIIKGSVTLIQYNSAVLEFKLNPLQLSKAHHNAKTKTNTKCDKVNIGN